MRGHVACSCTVAQGETHVCPHPESRLALTGAAVLALAVATGCSSAKEPAAAAPPTSSTTAAKTPSESTSASPSESESATTAPSQAPAGSAALTPGGTTLAFGGVANVEIGGGKTHWVGGIKVTALEKAPAADFKDLGVRDDVGTVYYLRYDVTYLSGTTTNPPNGGDVSWVRLHPLGAQGQRMSLVNSPSFKKCTTIVYKDGGGIDHAKEDLTVGETATNMCIPFVVDKGTVTQVVHTIYDDVKKKDVTTTWK